MGIYLVRGFVEQLPKGVFEAAKIDGAGNLTIMLRIIIPLVRNMILTIFLLQFITFWNDYQTALVFIPAFPTISLGLYYMSISSDDRLSQVPLRLSCCILVMLPILALFLLP